MGQVCLFVYDAIVEANAVKYKYVAKNVYHLHQKPLKNLLKYQFIQSLSDEGNRNDLEIMG